jgi:hypothetical protein
VTDADVVLGRLDPGYFAGGTIKLSPDKAGAAVDKAVGAPLGLKRLDAAFGVSEIVEENMANAARVHAVERGKELQDRTMIAFGGAAPIHAARLAEKLGISRIMVPSGAGRRLGGRLPDGAGRLRGGAQPLRPARRQVRSGFVNRLFAEMHAEAEAVVKAGRAERQAGRDPHRRHALSRPGPRDHRRPAARASSRPRRARKLIKLYEEGYAATFGRTIPGLSVEIMNWTLRLAAEQPPMPKAPPQPADLPAKARGQRAGLRPGRSGHEGGRGLSSRPTSRSAASCPARRSSPRTRPRPSCRRASAPGSARSAPSCWKRWDHEHQRSAVAHSPATDVGPPDRGRRGAGAGADAHRLLDLDARGGDLSAGVFDLDGAMLAQAVTGTPGHINSMARAVYHFLDRFPATP